MLQIVGEYLVVDDSNGERLIKCRKCGHSFCPTTENYKNYAMVREVPLNNLGDQYSKTKRFCFREFYCPGCMTLLWVDMTEKERPVLWDFQLK